MQTALRNARGRTVGEAMHEAAIISPDTSIMSAANSIVSAAATISSHAHSRRMSNMHVDGQFHREHWFKNLWPCLLRRTWDMLPFSSVRKAMQVLLNCCQYP